MARLSSTPVTEYLKLPWRDVLRIREALANVLERERAAREEAREE